MLEGPKSLGHCRKTDSQGLPADSQNVLVEPKQDLMGASCRSFGRYYVWHPQLPECLFGFHIPTISLNEFCSLLALGLKWSEFPLCLDPNTWVQFHWCGAGLEC